MDTISESPLIWLTLYISQPLPPVIPRDPAPLSSHVGPNLFQRLFHTSGLPQLTPWTFLKSLKGHKLQTVAAGLGMPCTSN